MTRKALGRGLSALLSADDTRALEDTAEIEVDLIEPSPMQPRSRFDKERLEELAQSIKANGVVQPILVRRHGLRYEVIAGERRWRASQLAGMTRIPALVRDVPDEKLLELALIENIQREDLNAIEEAQAYKKLIATIGLSQESLAARIGRDRSYITNYLRLLRLPEDIQALVADGKLSTGHARTLLGISDIDIQHRVSRKIIERGLSVRQTEQIIRGIVKGGTQQEPTAQSRPRDPNVQMAESKLRRRLGTQVRIIHLPSTGAGKIEIDFYDSADLDRVYRLLLSTSSSPV